jgi:hypothetical protein
MQIELNSGQDLFVWGLTNSGKCMVKSMYLDLMNDDTKYLKKVYLENESATKNQDFYVVLPP